MSNIGQLDQVRRFLRDHPDLHNQRKWTCGTTACVAGWTVALNDGARAGVNLDTRFSRRWKALVEDNAIRILNLTDSEADALFRRTMLADVRGLPHTAEEEALLLIDALITRDKGEPLSDQDVEVLNRYGLPTEPAGDAA